MSTARNGDRLSEIRLRRLQGIGAVRTEEPRRGLTIEQLESGTADTKSAMGRLHEVLQKDPRKRMAATPQSRRARRHALKRQRVRALKKSKTPTTTPSFPFLKLPTELRLAVYFELLVTDDRLVPTWRGPRKAQKQQKNMHIGILLASRRCRDEGLTVLYGENVFDLGEICTLPISLAKHFLTRIGPTNASLIRIVIAEYSAAAEELFQIKAFLTPRPIRSPLARAMLARGQARAATPLPHPHLSVPTLRERLAAFGIAAAQLRVLGVSLAPYGDDYATNDLMWREDTRLVGHRAMRETWLARKNEEGRMERVVEGICGRERELVRAEFRVDVDAKVGFGWRVQWMGRKWMVFRRAPEVDAYGNVALCVRTRIALFGA